MAQNINVQINNPTEKNFLKNVNKEIKRDILSKWILKLRIENDEYLDILFELDDIHEKVYNDNRVKSDFPTALKIATEHILCKFFF